ncbi:MAG: hypothetical protein AAB614_03080 [Patescibacteria group bacterium]
MLVKFVSILTIILTFFSISVYAEDYEINQETGKVRRLNQEWQTASSSEAEAIDEAIKNPGMEIPIEDEFRSVKFIRTDFFHSITTIEYNRVALYRDGEVYITKRTTTTHTNKPELIVYIILTLFCILFTAIGHVLLLWFNYHRKYTTLTLIQILLAGFSFAGTCIAAVNFLAVSAVTALNTSLVLLSFSVFVSSILMLPLFNVFNALGTTRLPMITSSVFYLSAITMLVV